MSGPERAPPEGLKSWGAFGGWLLRPRRPRLPEALAVATGIAEETVRAALATPDWDWVDLPHQRGLAWFEVAASGARVPQWAPCPERWTAASLWESLATRGLVPDAWIDDPTRRFHGGGRAPRTLTEAVLLASDAAGIASAEALAREAAQRLTPWSLRRAPRVVRWRLLDWSLVLSPAWRGVIERGPGGVEVGLAMRAATAAAGVRQLYPRPSLTSAGEAVAESPTPFRELAGSVASLVSAAEHWTVAARARAVAESPRVEFAAAPDPFEPLLALWAGGYGLIEVAPHLTLLLPTFEGFGPPTSPRLGRVPMGRTRPSPPWRDDGA